MINKRATNFAPFGDDGSREQGAAVVELALISFVILALLALVVEAGSLYLEAIQVVNAAREGARIGSATRPEDGIAAEVAVQQSVRTFVGRLVRNLPPENVIVSVETAGDFQVTNSDGEQCNDLVRVEVHRMHRPLLLQFLGLRDIELRHAVSMRYNLQNLCY